MANENGVIGWDDEVSASDAGENQQDELVVLPKGTYPCTIAKIERGSFKGSTKLPPCNKVKVGIIIDGGDAGRGWADHNFYMHTSTLWKIFQFLEAIGLRKKGDTTATAIPWSKVEKGMTCRCEIHPRLWNGKEYNEVEKWLSGEQPEEELDDFDVPF
ncbi:MAG: hypothetical protein ACI4QT_01805 [Kiritimatiellia bacterium]